MTSSVVGDMTNVMPRLELVRREVPLELLERRVADADAIAREVVADARRDELVVELERRRAADRPREVVGLARHVAVQAEADGAELVAAAGRDGVARLLVAARGHRDDVGRGGGDEVDEVRGADVPARGRRDDRRVDGGREDVDVRRVGVAGALEADVDVRLARLALDARELLVVRRRVLEAVDLALRGVRGLEDDLDRLLLALGERDALLEELVGRPSSSRSASMM